MGKILQWLVAIGLMALVYNVGLYFLKKDVVEVMAAPEIAAQPAAIPKLDGREVKPFPAAKAKEPAPEIERAPALMRQWVAPFEAPHKSDGLLNPARIYDLAFDSNGAHIVSVSKGAVHVWNRTTGKLLHSFPATEWLSPVVSRDGRFVAIPTKTNATIYEASTGRISGKYELEKDRLHTATWAHGGGAFSASGEYLLMGYKKVAATEVLAIESRTGVAKRVKVPNEFGSSFEFEQLEPIPGTSEWILNGRVGKTTTAKRPPVVGFDPATQKPTDLTALTIRPWTLSHNRGLRVSPDGTRAIAHDEKVVMVVDRTTDKELFAIRERLTTFSEPLFTPDGQRCLFLRHPHFYTIDLRPGAPKSEPGDSVELHDAKTGAKLASFTPESFGFAKRLTSVEVSHDGKTVAVAGGARLALFDFASAFGTAPLPARPVAREAEPYPFEN